MRQSRAAAGLLGLFVAAASCAIPMDAPIFGTQWSIPARSTTIPVNSFLPAGISATADNSAFELVVSPATVSITHSLGQLCPMCSVANRQTIPKPAFTSTGVASVALPAMLTSATLVRDTLVISITNGFAFDPLRPSATARGRLVLTVTSGATTLARDSIGALPAGTTIERRVPLSGEVTAAGGLRVTSQLESPAGDPITVDMTRTIRITGGVASLRISSAVVALENQRIVSAPARLDLTGVDSTIASHTDGGALVLELMNPFNVSGDLTLSFGNAGTPVVKQVPLTAGAGAPTISFTRDELRALLGRDLSLTFGGLIGGTHVALVPGQVVTVSSRLQIGVTVGGGQ